jgi:Protein of unknown function (DUF3099)
VKPPIQSVTTAHQGRSADISARQKRYLWMMGIRLACLPLALVVDGWARWVFIAGAVVLPYLAVVVANVVTGPRESTLTAVGPPPPPALTTGSSPQQRPE